MSNLDLVNDVLGQLQAANQNVATLQDKAGDALEVADQIGASAEAGKAVADSIIAGLQSQKEAHAQVAEAGTNVIVAGITDELNQSQAFREAEKRVLEQRDFHAEQQQKLADAANKEFLASQGLDENGKPLSRAAKIKNFFFGGDKLAKAQQLTQLSMGHQNAFNATVAARGGMLTNAISAADLTTKAEATAKVQMARSQEILSVLQTNTKLDQKSLVAIGEKVGLDTKHMSALATAMSAQKDVLAGNLQIGAQMITLQQLDQMSEQAKATKRENEFIQLIEDRTAVWNEFNPASAKNGAVIARALVSKDRKLLEDTLGGDISEFLAAMGSAIGNNADLAALPINERAKVEGADSLYTRQLNDLVKVYAEISGIKESDLLNQHAGVSSTVEFGQLDAKSQQSAIDKMQADVYSRLEQAKSDIALDAAFTKEKIQLTEENVLEAGFTEEFAEKVTAYVDSDWATGRVKSRKQFRDSIERTMDNLSIEFNKGNLRNDDIANTFKVMQQTLSSQTRNAISSEFGTLFENTTINNLPIELGIDVDFGLFGSSDATTFNLNIPTEWNRLFNHFAQKTAALRKKGSVQDGKFIPTEPFTGAIQ